MKKITLKKSQSTRKIKGLLCVFALLMTAQISWGQLTTHTPGDYTSTYGLAYTSYNSRDYEVYNFGTTTALYAGGQKVYKMCDIAAGTGMNFGWGMATAFNSSNSTAVTVSNSALTGALMQQINFRTNQNPTFKVKGYDQFSFVGKDNSASSAGKFWIVTINGVEQAMTTSSSITERIFTLDPSIESTIVLAPGSNTGSNHVLSGFSLRVAGNLGTSDFKADSSANVYSNGNQVFVSNVKSNTVVSVYSVLGALVKTVKTSSDTSFDLASGVWIVKAKSAEGEKSVKVLVR